MSERKVRKSPWKYLNYNNAERLVQVGIYPFTEHRQASSRYRMIFGEVISEWFDRDWKALAWAIDKAKELDCS